MPNSFVGIGVIGYGYWGPNLVRNFAGNECSRVISVSDLDRAKLAVSRRLHPEVGTTSDFRDLLQDHRVDAVAIATPVHTHYDLALAALRAGKHVFVEKPLAPTADQVRRLMEEADKRNLVLMVDHTFLYTPAVQKIRELVQEGTLGDIYYYDSIRSSLGLFQSDVNVIWDLAVHDISIIQHILDEKPIAVSATGSCHVSGAPENMAHITLFFESSCVAHVSVNWLSPIKVRQTFIGGSRKMIVYDDVEPTEKIKVYDKGITLNASAEKAHELRIGYRAGDMRAPHLATKEALQTEVQHFVDCLRDGKTPLSSAATGLQVVEILEAASRSIKEQGRPVRLGQVLKIPERA
jgi:predicted dehydrogenase